MTNQTLSQAKKEALKKAIKYKENEIKLLREVMKAVNEMRIKRSDKKEKKDLEKIEKQISNLD